MAKSPRDWRADMGFCTKFRFYRRKCYFLYSHAVNRTHFSAQLAYGKMTLLNFSLLFQRCEVKTMHLFRLCKVKFLLYFAVAKGFHFPKQPLAHSFHSLLRHLFRFEFAVLLFDCERYRLAAQSIPQFFSKLRAIVFFAAFFLKRKRVSLRCIN